MSRRHVVCIVAGVAAAAVAVGVDRAFFAGGTTSSRPELQKVLDDLVARKDAPGATAYVVGPKGTWTGAAGVADVARNTPMEPDARMRIESNSKTWLTAVLLQQAQEGKLDLDDTVDHVLPGVLRANGRVITLRQLMHDAGGLIDDNDVYRSTPAQLRKILARIHDPKLTARLQATAAALRESPDATVPARVFIDLAAWQPLVATPGTTYHHSNIGWNVLGLVAQKVDGKRLATVYRDRLFRPLGLHDTIFSPQGPIPGPHANGYGKDAAGMVADMTASHAGKFSDGAIVTDARDEATFLRALIAGKLFDISRWHELYGTPASQTCATYAWEGDGAGNGYRSFVWYDDAGSRVAVLLVNSAEGHAAPAAQRLYCAA
jgi:D-alanyl-D-alanine carboxypeptidase